MIKQIYIILNKTSITVPDNLSFTCKLKKIKKETIIILYKQNNANFPFARDL